MTLTPTQRQAALESCAKELRTPLHVVTELADSNLDSANSIRVYLSAYEAGMQAAFEQASKELRGIITAINCCMGALYAESLRKHVHSDGDRRRLQELGARLEATLIRARALANESGKGEKG